MLYTLFTVHMSKGAYRKSSIIYCLSLSGSNEIVFFTAMWERKIAGTICSYYFIKNFSQLESFARRLIGLCVALTIHCRLQIAYFSLDFSEENSILISQPTCVCWKLFRNDVMRTIDMFLIYSQFINLSANWSDRRTDIDHCLLLFGFSFVVI